MKNNEETVLTLKERVIKIRNSKSRYIKIPDGQFSEIKHRDEAEIGRKETDEKIYLTYVFKKE